MFPNQSIRYKLAPQMRKYDSVRHVWKPFIMFFNEANIKSNVLNLDKFGLRFNDLNNLKNPDIETNNSIFNEKIFSQYKETAVLVGASTAFGTGASSDTFTISSILSKKTNIHFFNLACSALSGFQETILFQSFINFLTTTKKIVILSGLNDLTLINYLSNFDPTWGPHYFSQKYVKGMIQSTLSRRRKLAKFLLDPFIEHDVNWNSVTMSELWNLFLKKKNSEKMDLPTKERLMKTIVSKNFQFWSNIQIGMGAKITYVLQPFANWCKRELSVEEQELFNELKTSSDKNYQNFHKIDEKAYINYKNFIKQNCNYFNFDFIDMNECFSNNNLDKKWLFVDRSHLTDLGNEHLAEFISSKLS